MGFWLWKHFLVWILHLIIRAWILVRTYSALVFKMGVKNKNKTGKLAKSWCRKVWSGSNRNLFMRSITVDEDNQSLPSANKNTKDSEFFWFSNDSKYCIITFLQTWMHKRRNIWYSGNGRVTLDWLLCWIPQHVTSIILRSKPSIFPIILFINFFPSFFFSVIPWTIILDIIFHFFLQTDITSVITRRITRFVQHWAQWPESTRPLRFEIKTKSAFVIHTKVV